MSDFIDRSKAVVALWKALYDYEDKMEKQFQESGELDIGDWFLHRIFVQNMSDIGIQTILNLPSAEPERQIELDGTESTIEILSELRAQFNCFEEYEEPVYHALSEAIKALSTEPERKKGKWDTHDVVKILASGKVLDGFMQCTVCGCIFDSMEYYFCPKCRADMRGDQDDST